MSSHEARLRKLEESFPAPEPGSDPDYDGMAIPTGYPPPRLSGEHLLGWVRNCMPGVESVANDLAEAYCAASEGTETPGWDRRQGVDPAVMSAGERALRRLESEMKAAGIEDDDPRTAQERMAWNNPGRPE